MRSFLLLMVFAAFLAGCSGSSSNSAASETPRVVYTGGGLKEMKTLTGKRVREIELWDHPDMNARLGKLLGDRLPEMTETWLIESSIVADGDILMAAGCEQNNCDRNQWVLFADVANDNLNIYNIKDGEMKSYKEKKEDIKLPQAFEADFNRMKAVQGVD